jgi:hypothetical protein
MASTRRVSLFKREIIERLSPAGFDVLLAGCGRLSEGQVTPDGAYYGSTMLTLDLSAAGPLLREEGDVGCARRLARLLRKERSLMRRVKQLARQEARRVAGRAIRQPEVEVRVRVEGARVLLDMDLEGEVQPPGRSRAKGE